MQDRRRTPRISLDVAVGFSTAHNFFAGRTRDISIGGLFIESHVAMDPGTPITVKLTLGRNTYQLDCTVAWVLDGGTASSPSQAWWRAGEAGPFQVARVERGLAHLRGLFVTGNAYRGVGINDCTREAENTAQRVLATLTSGAA